MKAFRILLIVASLVTGHALAQELIVNGGFELPVGTYSTITSLPGWYVSDNIDIQSHSAGGWPAYEGDQSIDLSGCATNRAYIEQAFPTVPGHLYHLSFHYANNIWEGQECRGSVRVKGSTILVDELLRHSGSTQTAMNYTAFETNFLADSTLTTLRFTHLFPPSSQCSGLALDAVEVTDQGWPPVTVNVPGKSNPWLAGMPNGSVVVGGCNDTAPVESPVQATGIQVSSGVVFTFSANGGTYNWPCCGSIGPEGTNAIWYSNGGPENGMANIFAPLMALVGVFLDDNVPNQFTPPPNLDFSNVADREFLKLQPALRQPFFIGDGLTSGGVTQQFVAPAGATRLFLGTLDSTCWSDNSGSFSVTVTRAPPQSFTTNGLVAYYPFNGNANDESGNGHDGVLHGGMSLVPTGPNGSCYRFNGVDGYVLLGNWFTFSSFTVGLWVNPDAQVGRAELMDNNHSLNGNWCVEATAESGLNIYGFEGVAPFQLQSNIWSHLVFREQNGLVTVFVNGSLAASGSWTISYDYPPNLALGVWIPNLSRWWKGEMDEVRIYNRALSDSEVQQLYAYESGTCFPYRATATATLVNGFVVGATISAPGCGYTNTPLVRFIGGGGTGAQAVAVVSNGVVAAINVLDAGIGYTNPPLVLIEPPFIPNPVLNIAPMSFLSFSNLAVGGVYQLQRLVEWYWSNQPASFTATSTLYTQMVAGVAGSGDYRLALSPVPAQAFATAQVVNGFVVGATVTSGGSGYVTSPAVTIVGDGGSNATAFAKTSGGVVTNITITEAGIGYTNTPTVQIAPPPAAAVSPTVLPVMRVDSTNLSPYDGYQIQFKPALAGVWANWNGEFFIPPDVTNSQYLFITNGVGFFRLQYWGIP